MALLFLSGFIVLYADIDVISKKYPDKIHPKNKDDAHRATVKIDGIVIDSRKNGSQILDKLNNYRQAPRQRSRIMTSSSAGTISTGL